MGNRLLIGGLALFLVTFTIRAVSAPAEAQAPAAPIAVLPPTTDRDYLGSKACAECHPDTYAQWERSLHVRMTKPIEEATIVGDFSGARLTAYGRSYRFARRNGRPIVEIAFGTRAPETFQVDYTLGFKRFQGYLSTLPDGSMYVLPAFWHVESRRWIDWKEITPIPADAHDLRQLWNTNCFNCHGTNISRGFDVEARAFRTTWTEMGIGCEACHGPGRPHVAMMERARTDPSFKAGGTLDIFAPSAGTARQTFDACAYCHGNKQNVFLGFRPGDLYEDYALPFLISAPIPEHDLQGEFWPDGRPNRFNRPQALTLSGCFKAGEVACTNCHVAHGSEYPFSLKVDVTQGREGDTLCTQCHETLSTPPALKAAGVESLGRPGRSGFPAEGGALEKHTFHAADSEGSRCINCHMSDVNWRLLIRRRDHTFQAPVPEMTAAFGVPNACNTCHDDRSPEWAARTMDEWWGDGERRRAAVSLADTMYRAGSGDPSVLPELARLAVDRSQGMVVRASAVQFMEQLALGTAGRPGTSGASQTSFGDAGSSSSPVPASPGVTLTPEQVNALIGAAADPEPTVRAQAVTALVASGDRDRILAPLLARLTDPARVVRARAAEALLALGIVELPGAAGEALARAQDEYAEALQAFPDVPSNHTALGWLESERGRVAEAEAALDRALHLQPDSVRALVIKGVIAARRGEFDNAVQLWRRVKSLAPGYPNIDRLIEEAEKRRGARH